MITVSALNGISGVRHAFFTRDGGVSEGVYASLNCGPGSDDEPRRVAENRTRALSRVGLKPDRLVTLFQEHGTEVVTVEAPWPEAERPHADAMVTRQPGLALGILTADCAPVLLADGEAQVVAAAHAGWKGALSGVLEATVDAMLAQGAKKERIIAGIGPCIALRSYEVGPDLIARFKAEDPASDDYFAPSRRDGHALFDLPGYVARRLSRHGVTEVMPTPCDTYREANRFFSYRRATHNQEADYGRMLSVVFLER
ncbi:peptidoglycan editing factor PgeF [Roseospirillum parvum]|uniref:Purine nucleoside phosphorylase n=1 Tax=Roseospirillum parvum TaxID=83401 RepID=A0A1G7TT97_9PROT|nr:peptidoglycan editing factor PgeF [Roseospirillum parvum]SDG37919.1 conserved hypothetical protein [Roseospirillum parvum]